MLKGIVQGGVLSIALLVSGSAMAQLTPPPSPLACQLTARTDAGYQAGYNTGTALANQTWVRVGQDCGYVDIVRDAVNNVISLLAAPLSSSAYAQCRFSGIVDGLAAFVSSVITSCQISCGDDGAIIGAIYAQAYCELAIMLNGVADPGAFFRPPTTICGDAFQLSCDSSFDLSAATYVTMTAQACAPYTIAPHDLEAANTRDLVCTYEAVPVTPSP